MFVFQRVRDEANDVFQGNICRTDQIVQDNLQETKIKYSPSATIDG
jgi:hypothetical protein